ncbi:MAG: ribulose-phosphate 3-epimerase [Thaumarchaeota archaeon]|jgi:ribulose-phosphate 3-epimerase|nr:ribulose-phosphate 3-epimerase [Candidatus Geocrenenecus arthurdayi]MCL7386922.1 ribulose-phosphate 3-epimerase [Candidatus Wolframiiraptor allenii]MCL7396508.1 ribulose-phosphate 3-epimerase [Candidatus Geocrenenecus arthurdayi]MCL7401946.1 ribulose-phosphate 3-epimerase [Candidatus Geocrenenecus arthurdayi]
MSEVYKKFLIPPPKIAPSILSADFRKLGEEVKKVEKAGADMLHFDIMDGHFVPNISFGPMVVKALRSEVSIPFLVHLMVEDPEKFLEQTIDAGADIVLFHVEASPHSWRILESIKKRGVKAGIALNPATPLSTVKYMLHELDMILLMTVSPGFGGQKFIPRMLGKISDLRKLLTMKKLMLDVAIDGGVTFENIEEIIEAGANVIIAGTGIFGQADIEEATMKLKKIANEKYARIISSQV